jgi:dethiobiotin synthetase
LVSALLCEILGAQYWKPIQAGTPTDREKILELTDNAALTTWPETYLLKLPASPHQAAKAEGLSIHSSNFTLPDTKAHLVIEGAGGILVPINDQEFVIDLPQCWGVPLVLVANLYLGSINHTLLTVSELKRRGLKVLGIVFNGPANKASEEIILSHSGYPLLFRLPQLENLNPLLLKVLATELRPVVLPLLLTKH